MVKFEAPEHTKGPLAGWSVTGRWVSVKADPEWRGGPGYEQYEFAHHYEPARSWQAVDPAIALERALWEWRQWRHPDSVTVDAVYTSNLSRPAGSQEDPFIGLEGTSHDGFERSRRSKERGRVSDE